MNPPDNLPPLPPVPNGYDVNAWEYRGTHWNPGKFANYAYYKPGLSRGWMMSFGCKPIGSSGHYIEAVREPAKDEREIAAFEEWLASTCPSGDHESVSRQWLDSSDYADVKSEPVNKPAAPCDCVQGYIQETGFDRCEKCNPAANKPAAGEADLTCPECNHWLGNEVIDDNGTVNCANCKLRWTLEPTGVEARVCETMSDRPTPLTDDAEYHSGPDTCTAIEGMVDSDFARDLERKLDEAREALELADRLIAACGYMPTDTTRSKIKQALARIDANQQKP